MGTLEIAQRRNGAGFGQATAGLLAVVFALACAGDTGVIATYRGGTVTRDDLDDRALVLPEAHRPPQEQEAIQEWRRRLARQIVLERVLMPEERLVPREGTILEPGPWRRELVRILVEREGLRRVDVPEDSVTARYEQEWSRFFLPQGVVFQHVFLPFPAEGGAGRAGHVKALAESLHAVAASGADFDELVNAYSKSESKQWGGRVGVVFRGQLGRELERVLFSLDEGEIGGPVATEHGYHIVKVLERRPEQMKPFDEVAPIITHELLVERLASMRDSYFEALGQEFPTRLAVEAYYEPGSDDDPILEVAGETVTRRELADWLARFRRRPEDPEQLREFLELRAVDARLYRKAVEHGLAEDPIAVGRYRAAAGRAFIDSLLESRVQELTIEEPELRAFYEKHPRRFSEPKRWKIREILVLPADGEPYDAWRKATRIAEQARDGADFAALARRHSAAPSAERGGDLGELTLEDTARRGPEFQKSLFSLEEGGVSDAARSGSGGYFILKLERITEARERPFEEVKDWVRREYILKNQSNLVEQEADRLASEAGYRFHGDKR